jgi:exoribonuclease R
MPKTVVLGHLPGASLEDGLEALLAELGVDDGFSPDVLADAQRSAAEPDLPDRELLDLPLVTIDPPGSLDLDQALWLERRGNGFRVYYAIADVAAFVRPGSATDVETRRRGATVYAPHRRIPLHPTVLSEQAASLLPDGDRPAMVWQIDVDGDGTTTAAHVQRAMVRSRARYSYEQVHHDLLAGRGAEPFVGLARLGLLLQEAQRGRGGATLRIPDQEIEAVEGGYTLRYRPLLPVEEWNAQVSLLAGRAAADLMAQAGVGVLRTLPGADERSLQRFRRQAQALGVDWPDQAGYGRLLESLDPEEPAHLALLHDSGSLFRGAGYTAFTDGAPEHAIQAAIADEYAHVTAPLRRLVDRFGTAICEAVCRDAQPPQWAVQALPELPTLMRRADRIASALERASVDLAEAVLLSGRVGEVFDAMVVEHRSSRGADRALVQLTDPAVLAWCTGTTELGCRVRVRLEQADVATRTVVFAAC